MKKKLFLLTIAVILSFPLFAASGNKYAELFTSVTTITEIAKYLGIIVLTLSLIAEGVITFFGNNMSEVVKHTMGRVATGGCFIGGAATLTGFILGNGSSSAVSVIVNDNIWFVASIISVSNSFFV